MAKLIIYVSGKPLMNGYKVREFQWSEVHRCYLYEGRELDAAEFNEKWEKAYRNNGDLLPRVRVTDAGNPPTPAPANPAPEPVAAPPPEPVPVPEPTLDEAIAIVQRLAPDRLKSKPGRKPSAHVEVED